MFVCFGGSSEENDKCEGTYNETFATLCPIPMQLISRQCHKLDAPFLGYGSEAGDEDASEGLLK